MNKIIALVLVCLLVFAAALAESSDAKPQWGEGLNAAKPYEGSVEIDLTQKIGHILRFPQANLPAEHYCDVLEIYMPREDVALGQGTLRLFDENGEVAAVDFADADAVEIRPLENMELESLIWGSGVCIEIHLPVSLRFDSKYYVTMDEGCFTAAGGKLPNPAVDDRDYKDSKGNIVKGWEPVVTGDFGISGLYYSASAEEGAAGAPAAYKAVPEVGDVITFDVVLGGEAVAAVVFSENDSVLFEQPEYTESGTAVGVVTGEDLDWGVVFLNEAGDVIADESGNVLGVGEIRLGR